MQIDLYSLYVQSRIYISMSSFELRMFILYTLIVPETLVRLFTAAKIRIYHLNIQKHADIEKKGTIGDFSYC